MTWELEIEYIRGGYLGKLYGMPAPLRGWVLIDQYRDQYLWYVIHRLTYAAVIWPSHLN